MNVMTKKATVLIVDDEPNALRVLSAILQADGYRILEADNVDKAIGLFEREQIDAIISDIKMPGKDGYDLFEHASEFHPDIPLIFLTAYGNVESAVEDVTNGAYYYFLKPPDYHKLKSVLAEAIQHHEARRGIQSLEAGGPGGGAGPAQLIGNTPAMLDIFKTIARVKDTESSVLIQGETGTGKEVIAASLHQRSVRHDRPFIAVNCAAIPRELMESELFGVEKGAFTGAHASRTGKIEEANNGTLFLDEIGELELSLQAKLLRVLQERTIERLGSNRKTKVNFRLVCSTNRDLKKEMEAGRFRSDLYYRINVVPITVPALRDRRDDIPMLIAEFLQEVCAREKRFLTLDDRVRDELVNYSWPGNVRQLKNVIEHAVVIAKGKKITLHDLPPDLQRGRQGGLPAQPTRTLKNLEQQAIAAALLEAEGNKSKAARILGISRKALYAKLKTLPQYHSR
jgi:DNA-binding NtrC family response regulator